ncbi:MAG: HflC protein [Desulfobacterales bacterium CG23_combo_of_CG06-09_8_20_14_all_51_8]|nr:MAG: HflC protein [Desulfobacterales bacterium CG23_combo_of_CG06-09_8_20_14_all_51_8]
MKTQRIVLIGIVLLMIIGFASSAYIVDETEQVVITKFRRVVGEPITEPGLKFRIPVIYEANYFPKNIQAWNGEPGQIITQDKSYIWADTFARWRIVDPIAFIKIVRDMPSAQSRLSEIINPAVRDAITSHKLIETVRNSNRKMSALEVVDTEMLSVDSVEEKSQSDYQIQTGRAALTREILKASQPKLKNFGIELLDVKIKRLNYIETVRESVYNRMIAERKQVAEKIRSEGRGKAQGIEGDKEKDLKQIQSDAYRTAQEIKGKADAEATKIYADAFNLDPEYYSFTKALDVYQTSLDKKSRMVLSTDSEFLRYLKDFSASGKN